MNWTRTDAARRRIVVAGLIAGPALLVLSVAINLTGAGGSMRSQFDHMATTASLVIVEAFLETLGFTLVLAAFAGAAGALRTRGGALGTWGAGLAMIGIAGFALSNAGGFTLAALAQLPHHDAAFTTAGALFSSDTIAVTGTITMVMELAGQVGILLEIVGLARARIVSFWILALVVLGIAVNLAFGTMLTTLIADVLLLAAGVWVGIALARASHETWLGAPQPERVVVTV
jgi:hypothetical protein